jgi:hypothetical protein
LSDGHSPESARSPASKATALERLAPVEAQLLCRAINEQIRSVTNDFGATDELDLVCECSKPGCWELLRVSASDYEDVRRFPTRFFVRPNHASEETERIVDEGPDLIVVEKYGADAEQAIRQDPRKLNNQASRPSNPDQATALDGQLLAHALLQQRDTAIGVQPDASETIIRHRRPSKEAHRDQT